MSAYLFHRTLGKSELRISPLGLGCWQFSKGTGVIGKFWPEMSDLDIRTIIEMSIEGGINWFDTAEVYGWGQSEKALANALIAIGEPANNVVIATKWWPLFRGSNSITGSIHKRIESLNGRTIDLYQIHQPFSFSSIRDEMKAMAKLIKDGQIRYAGVSNFSAKQMKQAHQSLAEYGFQLVSNQVKYSLLDRKIEQNGVLETAQELGMSIIAYSPLEQGILTGKFHENPDLIKNSKGPRKYQSKFKSSGLTKSLPLIGLLAFLAEQYGVSIAQIALNWLIHYHGDTVVAIPGASKVQHAKENIGALQFKLSSSELEQVSQTALGLL